MTPRIADGGLATSLQERGLAPFTPVDPWMRDQPERIREAHQRFVEAGANLILTGTFTLSSQADATALAEVAARVALDAARGRADVWASIGPYPDDMHAWEALVDALAPRITGFVLETFSTVHTCTRALHVTRRAGLPVVASLTVRDDGRLHDGFPAPDALWALLDAGASAVGLNCGEVAGIELALRTWRGPGLWLRPGRLKLSPRAWVDRTRALAPLSQVLGGCCGVSPSMIRALAEGPWP